jgi:hypothetical protein
MYTTSSMQFYDTILVTIPTSTKGATQNELDNVDPLVPILVDKDKNKSYYNLLQEVTY